MDVMSVSTILNFNFDKKESKTKTKHALFKTITKFDRRFSVDVQPNAKEPVRPVTNNTPRSAISMGNLQVKLWV